MARIPLFIETILRNNSDAVIAETKNVFSNFLFSYKI